MSQGAPSVSIIIPTLNEEHVIGALLECLVPQQPDEIIVADGCSSDRTVEIASHHARVVRSAPIRGTQMNHGAEASSGEVLLFLHADVRPSSRAVEELRRTMRTPAIIGGNFSIRYEGRDMAAAFFTWVSRVRRPCGVFYGDSGIFCRRNVFEGLGGYRPWQIMEDYEFARRLWRAGKLALLDEPIGVSARRWRKLGLPRTVWSWVWIQGLYSAGMSPGRLAKMYRNVR